MNKRGFTLVELMIVIVIIGLLAAIAIPKYNVSSYKAKEKEADQILKHVYSMQSAYFTQHSAYAASIAELESVGFNPPSHLEYYTWNGDASIANRGCLVSTGSHDSKLIDFTTGQIEVC